MVDLGRWEPLTPGAAAALLRDYPAPWWIAGGWAFDLLVGRQTRPHEDLDVELLLRDQVVLQQYLAGWDLQIAQDGVLTPWAEGERLTSPGASLWCRPAPTAPWALQVIFAPTAGDAWCYHRYPTVQRPLSTLGLRNAAGIPFLAPEVQLLYKSRGRRPKDLLDHARMLPLLTRTQRQWLRGALQEAAPEHQWIATLATTDEEE